ncbi:MAG: hypothetical protein JNJ73_04195 [Hyphomonadaceae bacterium]|nr:hypothetical protein [Hyphomonadaceae bacterium]
MRWLAALLVWIAATAGAAAQTAPPGWSVRASADAWVAVSPDQGRGLNVRMIFFAPVQDGRPIAAWLEAESGRHTASLGRVIWAGNPVAHDDPTLLSKGRTYVETQTNVRVAAFAWGYETPRGRQLAMILKPMDLADANAAYQGALDVLAGAWRARYAYAPSAAGPAPSAQAAAPSPAAAAPARQNGRNCRREPVWGFRLSPFCQPSGVCPDRVIKSYETVCD